MVIPGLIFLILYYSSSSGLVGLKSLPICIKSFQSITYFFLSSGKSVGIESPQITTYLSFGSLPQIFKYLFKCSRFSANTSSHSECSET